MAIYSATNKGIVEVTCGKSSLRGGLSEKVNQEIVLCLDDDGEPFATDKAIIKAVEDLQSRGNRVGIVAPNGGVKDYNELLKMAGPRAVQDSLANPFWLQPENTKAQLEQLDEVRAARSQTMQSVSFVSKAEHELTTLPPGVSPPQTTQEKQQTQRLKKANSYLQKVQQPPTQDLTKTPLVNHKTNQLAHENEL